MDLASSLPLLLPHAIEWAEAQAAEVLAVGGALSPSEQRIARAVGVAEPERVRVLLVTHIPRPYNGQLAQAAAQVGLLGPGTLGLTLGHAIFIRQGHLAPRLLAHECRHVHQYEQHGSIAAYLAEYLQQLVTFGYEDSPLERDARQFEHLRG